MYKISLNRVHDIVRINEGNDALDLKVDSDPMRMVAGLNLAHRMLREVTESSTDQDVQNAAMAFAEAIFGNEQATELLKFYRGDASCVVNVCGQYFSKRLAKLIAKAQKKA